MKFKKNYTECPFCHGTSGYVVRVILTSVRTRAWNGEEIELGNLTTKTETSPVCADCWMPLRGLTVIANRKKRTPL